MSAAEASPDLSVTGEGTAVTGTSDIIRWFDTASADVPLVGGKNASLGELYRASAPQGVRVPNGFALTAEAYRDALTAGGRLAAAARSCSTAWTSHDVDALAQRAAAAREIVYAGDRHGALRADHRSAYRAARSRIRRRTSPVAVRSSATAEDLPNASFAGQHESYPQRPRRRRPCSRPAAAASPRSSPTGRSSTASTTASTISRSRCRSAS